MSRGVSRTALARLFPPTIVTRVYQLLGVQRYLQTCGQTPRGCSAKTSSIEIVSFRDATVSLTDGWAEGPVERIGWSSLVCFILTKKTEGQIESTAEGLECRVAQCLRTS